MSRIYVHDFKFDYKELKNRLNENDFYCGVTVYYNLSPEYPGDGFNNLQHFFISVATSFGLANYLSQCIEAGLYPSIFFFSHLLIVQTNDEDEIMNFIKSELHSIYGRTEKELILKAIRKFDWESENIPEVYDKLFR